MTELAQRIVTVAAAFLCVTAISVADATACSCASPGSACGAAKRANAVFVGRVTSLAGGVQFDVERAVAGVPLGAITVGNGPGNCALSFTVGRRYVVYAFRDPGGGLVTNMCTRTLPLSDPHARADIAYFGRRERNAAGGLLTGVVSDVTADLSATPSTFRALVGVPITVSFEAGDRPAMTTSTRSDGSYELAGLPPGRVRIAASLPAEFEPQPPITAMIADGCGALDIGGRVDGRIRGHLFDERGRPARGVGVQLADAAAARGDAVFLPTNNTLTDEEGAFEFRYVRAGRYVVGVELQQSLRPGKLDKRRFYPNSREVEAAEVVTLAAAQRLELPAFRLATLPSDRAVTVVVHAPSAELAEATRLFLTGSQREPIVRGGATTTLRLPFGAFFLIEAVAPGGYKVTPQTIVRIDRDDTDRTVEFRVEK